jgi:hypothetical protein
MAATSTQTNVQTLSTTGLAVAVNCNLDRDFTWAGGKGQYQPNK